MDHRAAGGDDGLDGIATLESCETQFQVFEVHQARERGATDFVDEMAKYMLVHEKWRARCEGEGVGGIATW